MSSTDFINPKDCFDETELNLCFDDKKNLYNEKPPISHPKIKFNCGICNQQIDSDIARILIMRDKDGGPRLFFFHFFFPCWDFKQLCQNYPNLIIDKVGFSIPENIAIKKSAIENLQKNLEFWN